MSLKCLPMALVAGMQARPVPRYLEITFGTVSGSFGAMFANDRDGNVVVPRHKYKTAQDCGFLTQTRVTDWVPLLGPTPSEINRGFSAWPSHFCRREMLLSSVNRLDFPTPFAPHSRETSTTLNQPWRIPNNCVSQVSPSTRCKVRHTMRTQKYKPDKPPSRRP